MARDVLTIAYLGLGSNVGDRQRHLRRALELLDARGALRVAAVSSVYETQAWGNTEQEPFLNAVAEVETALDARGLLAEAKAVEAEMGRRRTHKWGPRIIDLDILVFGDERVTDPDLCVPHGLLMERQFALVPLAELAPELKLPDGRTAREAARPDDASVRKLGPLWPGSGGR